jgi:hypothetical protein
MNHVFIKVLYFIKEGKSMQTQPKPLVKLNELFSQQYCWTIEQLGFALDYSAISIRRFLKQLGYFSSFTHNSKWYTLSSIPEFDNNGLWFYNQIGFSRHGNLKQNIVHFIDKSSQGLSAKQLAEILSVSCHAVLNHMYHRGTIDRFKSKAAFVYVASAPKRKNQQLMRFQSQQVAATAAQELTPQTAVYVLVEYIKNPHASFDELANAVAKRQVIAPPKAIARFFDKHALKKTLK